MWDWIIGKVRGAQYFYDNANKIKRTGRVIDYTKHCWGHDLMCFYTTKTKTGISTPLIYTFLGFGSICVGDILLSTIDGEVSELLVIQLSYKRDPSDMFDATALNLTKYNKEGASA